MDTKKQREKRNSAIRKIIGALVSGRSLSMYDSREFEVAEMHTCFCYIRKAVESGKIPGYVMKDEWRTNEDSIRYKVYWFEKVNG